MSAVLAPGVRELLDGERVARLGTADARGRPLVVPVCYAFDGAYCYSALDAKPKRRPVDQLRRVRNIRENPHACLVVDCYDEDWTRLRYVIIQGRADLLTGGPEFARAVDLLLDKYPQYRAMQLDRESGLVIKITPERVVQWSSSAAGSAMPQAGHPPREARVSRAGRVPAPKGRVGARNAPSEHDPEGLVP
jgi:PPOX class probable F420-dependent enzyme